MKRVVVLGVFAVGTVLTLIMFCLPSRAPQQAAVDHASESAPPSSKQPEASAPEQTSAPRRIEAKRKVDRAEREAYRREIAERLAERARSRPAKPESAASPKPDADEPAREPGQIRDRSEGKLSKFVGTVNEDFMPLAEECYQQALEQQPDLGGLLDMNVSIIADEELGGLVESAELGAGNEIAHAGMTECIRETMLSTIFPPLDESGRADVRLTLRFAPDEK